MENKTDREFSRSISELSKGGKLYNFPEAYQNYLKGVNYIKINNIELGIKNLELAIEKTPDLLSAYLVLGDIYLYEKKITKGKRIINRGLKYYPDDFRLHLLKGELLMYNKDFKEGLSEMKRASKLAGIYYYANRKKQIEKRIEEWEYKYRSKINE